MRTTSGVVPSSGSNPQVLLKCNSVSYSLLSDGTSNLGSQKPRRCPNLLLMFNPGQLLSSLSYINQISFFFWSPLELSFCVQFVHSYRFCEKFQNGTVFFSRLSLQWFMICSVSRMIFKLKSEHAALTHTQPSLLSNILQSKLGTYNDN